MEKTPGSIDEYKKLTWFQFPEGVSPRRIHIMCPSYIECYINWNWKLYQIQSDFWDYQDIKTFGTNVYKTMSEAFN